MKCVSPASDMPDGTFQKDTKTQDAVIRNLEVIGEATKISLWNSVTDIRMSLGKVWLE